MTAEQPAVFPVAYRCGSERPGGAILTVQFLVNTSIDQVQGMGHLTQATNPPIDVHIPMHGHFEDDRTIVLYAVGSRPGAAIQLHMILPEGWGNAGECEFQYYAMNQHGTVEGPAEPIRQPVASA